MRAAVVVVCVVVSSALYFVFLAGGKNEYPDTDTSQLDRNDLFRITEKLLEDSEAWPAELTADGVVVSSSLEPYPARAVRYSRFVLVTSRAKRRRLVCRSTCCPAASSSHSARSRPRS